MLEFKRIPEQIEMVTKEVLLNPNLYERDIPLQTKESVYASEDKKSVMLKEQEAEYERVSCHTGNL